MAHYTFGQNIVSPSVVQKIAYPNLVDNLDLVWPTSFAGSDNVFAVITEVEPSVMGLTISLPQCDQVGVGQQGVINNLGPFAIYVTGFTGIPIATVAASTAVLFYVTNNANEAGEWFFWVMGAGTASAQAQALAGYGLYAAPDTMSGPYLLNTHFPVEQLPGGPVTVLATDQGKLLIADTTNLVSSISLPTADKYYVAIENLSNLVIPVTATSGLINKNASLNLLPFQNAIFVCDGTNWFTIGLSAAPSPSNTFSPIEVAIPTAATTVILTSDQLTNDCILFTGTLTANVTVFVNPVNGRWLFQNLTTGAFTLNVQYGLTSSPQGAPVPILTGQNKTVYGIATFSTNGLVVEPNRQDIVNGGTGGVTANQGFYNLSPMTTPGDLIVGGAASTGFTTTPERIGAPASPVVAVLGCVGQIPQWVFPDDDTNSFFLTSIAGVLGFTESSGQSRKIHTETFTTTTTINPNTSTNVKSITVTFPTIGKRVLVNANIAIQPPLAANFAAAQASGGCFIQLSNVTNTNAVTQSFGTMFTKNDVMIANLWLVDSPSVLMNNYVITVNNSIDSTTACYINSAPSNNISIPALSSSLIVYQDI